MASIEQQYEAALELGENVRQFWVSDTGRYLHKCIEQDVEQYRDSLEKIDLDSEGAVDKLKELQLRARAARSIYEYVSFAFQQADVAVNAVEEMA